MKKGNERRSRGPRVIRTRCGVDLMGDPSGEPRSEEGGGFEGWLKVEIL
jgi:hypothetical protein